MDHLVKSACEHRKKNRINVLGDLGFEPRSQRSLTSVPATTPHASFYYLDNKQSLYIKQSTCCKIKSKTRAFQIGQPYANTSASSTFVLCKRESNSGGFQPPLPPARKNIREEKKRITQGCDGPNQEVYDAILRPMNSSACLTFWFVHTCVD